MTNLITMGQSLRYHSIQACVNYGCGAARLSYQYIFHLFVLISFYFYYYFFLR